MVFNFLYLDNGNVLIWGSHKDGLMGLGYNLTSVEIPTRLESLKFIKEISMSEAHAVVIDNKGEAYSWGSGKYGELGLERIIYSPFPTKISGAKIFSKVFCSELLTCFIDKDKNFSYFGVIIKIFKGSNSSITLKSLLRDESNSDPNFIFQEKVIYELESERFLNISIGNGFIGLLSEKGLVYTLDYSDNITILYSKYFVYSISVSNNQLFGLCRDNNKLNFPNNKQNRRNEKEYDLKKSYSANNTMIDIEKNINYYLCRWVASFFDRDISSDSWSTHLYKISDTEVTENMHLLDSKNKDVLLFFNSIQEKKNMLNSSSNNLLSPVNNNPRLFLENNNRYFDESWQNTTYNDECALKKNNINDSGEIFYFVITFDDSYNMKYKRVKNAHGAIAMPSNLVQNRKNSIPLFEKGIGINTNKNKNKVTRNQNLDFSRNNSNNNSMVNQTNNDDLSNLILKQNIEKFNFNYIESGGVNGSKLNNNTAENIHLNEKLDLRKSNELFKYKNNEEDVHTYYNISDQYKQNLETQIDTSSNNYLFNFTAAPDDNLNLNNIDQNILNALNMSNNENVNYKTKSDRELRLNINSNYSDRERDNLYSPENLVRMQSDSSGFSKMKRDKSSEVPTSTKMHDLNHNSILNNYQSDNFDSNDAIKKVRSVNRYANHMHAQEPQISNAMAMTFNYLDPYSPKVKTQNNPIDSNKGNTENFFQSNDLIVENQPFNPHKRHLVNNTNKYKSRSSSLIDGELPDINRHTPKSLNENVFNLNLVHPIHFLKNKEVNDAFYLEIRNSPNISSSESAQSNYKRKNVSKTVGKDTYYSNPNKDAMLIEDFSSDTNDYSKSNFNVKSSNKLNILTNFNIKSKDNSSNGEEEFASNISNNNSNINFNEKLNNSNENLLNQGSNSISSPGSKYIRNFNKTEKNTKYLVYTFTETEEEEKGEIELIEKRNPIDYSRSTNVETRNYKMDKEDNPHYGSISFCASNNFFKKISQINTNFNVLQGVLKKLFIRRALNTLVMNINDIDSNYYNKSNYNSTNDTSCPKDNKYLIFFSKIFFRVLTVCIKENKIKIHKEIMQSLNNFSNIKYVKNLMRKYILNISKVICEKYFNRFKKVSNYSKIFLIIDSISVKHLSDTFFHFKHFAKVFNLRKKYFSEFFSNLNKNFLKKKQTLFINLLYKHLYYSTNKDLIKNKLAKNFSNFSHLIKKEGFKNIKINYLSTMLMIRNFNYFINIINSKILEYKQRFINLTFLKIRKIELMRDLVLKKHRVRIYIIKKSFKYLKNFTLKEDPNIFVNVKLKKVIKILFYQLKMNLLKVLT